MSLVHLGDDLWMGSFGPTELDRFGLVVMCAPLRPDEVRAGTPLANKLYHLPFTDDVQPPSEREQQRIETNAYRVLGYLEHLEQTKCGPVAVCCREGKNRSGVVRRHGLAAEEAIARVQAHRPGALYNWYFCEYLKALPRS